MGTLAEAGGVEAGFWAGKARRITRERGLGMRC